MLINETQFNEDALKHFNIVMSGKGRLYIGILQLMACVGGVLVLLFNINNFFLVVLGGAMMVASIVAFIITVVFWGKFANKQLIKFIQKNPSIFQNVVIKYNFNEEDESFDVDFISDGVSKSEQRVKVNNLFKVVSFNDYLFLFVTPKNCLVFNKSSMIEGNYWEVEMLLKKVLLDKFIIKKAIRVD